MTPSNSAQRLSRHEVKNLVISCIDFRFLPDMHAAILQTFGIDDFDEIKLAGGAGNLSMIGDTNAHRQHTVLDDVALAVGAHHVDNVYLINHQNCGAYAKAGAAFGADQGDAEKSFHAGELQKAAGLITEKFPDVSVHTAFASVDPQTDEIVLIR